MSLSLDSVAVCLSGAVSADGARTAITQRAKQAGIEDSISGHSLRIGSAISLGQAGAGIPDMQVVGRWKNSNMPVRYAFVFWVIFG